MHRSSAVNNGGEPKLSRLEQLQLAFQSGNTEDASGYTRSLRLEDISEPSSNLSVELAVQSHKLVAMSDLEQKSESALQRPIPAPRRSKSGQQDAEQIASLDSGIESILSSLLTTPLLDAQNNLTQETTSPLATKRRPKSSTIAQSAAVEPLSDLTGEKSKKQLLALPQEDDRAHSLPVCKAEKQQVLFEFALKLGFTREDCAIAIGQLGDDTDNDTLLGALIKIKKNSKLQEAALPRQPAPDKVPSEDDDELRGIVIDGSNVAMAHGNGEKFSCRGIEIAVHWFKQRGHRKVTVFVPAHRLDSGQFKVQDQYILSKLKRDGVVVLTPSRRTTEGRRATCYDDRFILKLASEDKSVVVSNDRFRDIYREQHNYRETINQRLVPFTFAGDRFMPAEDPQGRHGLTLDQILRKKPYSRDSNLCPYGRKCTYGLKCKFRHPERENKDSAIVESGFVSDFSLSSGIHQPKYRESTGECYSLPSDLGTAPLVPHRHHHTNTRHLSAQARHSLPEDFNQALSLQHNYPTSQPHNLMARGPTSRPPLERSGGSLPYRQFTTATNSFHGDETYASLPDHLKGSQYPPMSLPQQQSMPRTMSDGSLAFSEYSMHDYELGALSDQDLSFSTYDSQQPSSFGQLTLQPPTGAMPQYFGQTIELQDNRHHLNKHLNADTKPIATTDPRYNVYYHLKELFPEKYVLIAMNRMPNETNSKKLCEAILALQK